MPTDGAAARRAGSLEELEPLRELCRLGKLFDVQEWIRGGKPIALPTDTPSRRVARNPLYVAVDKGFHSLVQVLLEAGSPVREPIYDALEHAVELRRPDLVALLIERGADAADISMRQAFASWHPEVFELLLAQGASLIRGWPVAWALTNKVRPALGLLKRFPDDAHLKLQADLALRFHSRYGSPKWVALMLWAGADPWSVGPIVVDDQDEAWEPDPDDTVWSAVNLAVSGRHPDVLKKLLSRPPPERHDTDRLLQSACFGTGDAVLSILLEHGHRPGGLPDRGTGLLNTLWWALACDRGVGTMDSFGRHGPPYRASVRTTMMRRLVEHGARWLPETHERIAEVRRNVLRTDAECLLSFLATLAEHGAAQRDDVHELLRTPAVGRMLGDRAKKADRLVASLPSR